MKYIDENIFQQIKKYIINKDDLYLTIAGTIGNVGVVPDKFDGMNLTENAVKLTNILINRLFVNCFINSNLVQNQFVDKTNTVAQPKLAIERILTTIIPLPPLAEQKRIVEKIEELLPHIEEYDKAEQKLAKLNKEFPDQLKKSILQYAVEGKLVPQDKNDEPASVLLEKLKAEKEKLIKEKKIKREKPLAPITDEEKPFDIPESWEWCRLGEIILLKSGQDLTPDKYNSFEQGIPYITGASNIENNDVIINRWTEEPKSIAYNGDLLITCKGTVGAMAFMKIEKAHIARQIMAISTFYTVSIHYLRYYIETEVERLKAVAKSMIPGISRDEMLTMKLPLPPLAEQKRIVEKIEEVFKVCEGLK